MAKPFFDLERIDPDGLRRVGGILRSAGLTETGVRERLGLEDVSQLRLAAYPYYRGHCLRRRKPVDTAIDLFLLQGAVTEEALGELFDAAARKVLKSTGLLAADRRSRTVRARASLYPLQDRLLCCDHRFLHDPWVRARVPREPVMYLGADSYYLARSTVQRPVRSVLDLCTGSGVHAILAAGTAERAVGVDVNPRAVNFARFNALLNDAWNAVFLEGDLFGPVGGERFDLVLANPPFVASPVYELAYRDGGPSGADVLRRIIAALPDFLASDGLAQIVTHVAEREGESYLERIRRWMGGANMNLHSLLLGEEDVVDYAIAQTRRTFGERYHRYERQLLDWFTNMRAQRFKRVVGIVLTCQWNHDAHPPWTQEDECKPPVKPVSGELTRLLGAKKRVRGLSSLDLLDGMRVGVPDDLVLAERRRPTGSGFEPKGFRVTFKTCRISPELDIKPLVRDLLERIDNNSTVPQVIARLAEDTGKPLSELNERCRRAFLIMFERGLITLDEVAAVAPPEASQAARPQDPFLYSGEGPEDEPPAAGQGTQADGG